MKSNLSVVSNDSGVTLASKANAVGVALGEMQKALAQVNVCKETINKLIAELHNGKAKVGIYRKDGTGCGIATAFVDGCVEAGLSHSTAQKTYLPTFKQAVGSGKPVGDWNGQRAKGKGKGGKAGEPKSLANKLATCWRDGEFQDFLDDLQASYENDEIKTLKEGVRSYLEAQGIEIKDPTDE